MATTRKSERVVWRECAVVRRRGFGGGGGILELIL